MDVGLRRSYVQIEAKIEYGRSIATAIRTNRGKNQISRNIYFQVLDFQGA